MMRTLRVAGLVSALIFLALGASWVVQPSTSKAAFNATTFNYSTTLLMTGGATGNFTHNQPQTLFAVPPGQDLTITDITYTFSFQPALPPNFAIPPGIGHEWPRVTLYDGGPNANPTNFGPNAVSDSASLCLQSFSNLIGENMEIQTFEVETPTVSRHFQTGLVIPSGNNLDIVQQGGMALFGVLAVDVHISGILQ